MIMRLRGCTVQFVVLHQFTQNGSMAARVICYLSIQMERNLVSDPPQCLQGLSSLLFLLPFLLLETAVTASAFTSNVHVALKPWDH